MTTSTMTTELCPTCWAPADTDACPFDTDELRAPWAGDYAAIHDGRMSHDEHKLSVARWTMHQPPGASAAIRAHFEGVARDGAGVAVVCNALESSRM